MAAGLIAAGLLVGLRRGAVVRAPERLTTTWMVALVVALAATVASVDPLLSVVGDPVRLMGLATVVLLFGAFAIGAATGEDGPRLVGTALLAGGAVMVAVGIGQLALGDGGRPVGAMGNAGFLGAYLCLLLPVAASRLAGSRVAPLWIGPLLVGATVLLIATGTRGAWVGAAAAIGLLAAVAGRRLLAAVGVVAVIAIAVGGARRIAR